VPSLEDERQARIAQQEATPQRIEVNPNPLTADSTSCQADEHFEPAGNSGPPTPFASMANKS
jgi:hypothetical protein